MSNDGNCLIGPGHISLWCRYPYVFGHVAETSVKAEVKFFVLNLANMQLDWFSEDAAIIRFHKLRLDAGLVVGIGTLINNPRRNQIKQTLADRVGKIN